MSCFIFKKVCNEEKAQEECFYEDMIQIMVLILDGNSDIGATCSDIPSSLRPSYPKTLEGRKQT
mgnify:CR=1 FL=1